MLNKLSKEVHAANIKKGFYETEREIGTILCLIHAELSEALEADREDKFAKVNPVFLQTIKDDAEFKTKFEATTKDTFEDEIADVIIRCLDLTGYKGINIEAHIAAKIRYNSLRKHKHGGKKY